MSVRLLKWIALVMCALTLLSWLGSARWNLSCVYGSSYYMCVEVSDGCVVGDVLSGFAGSWRRGVQWKVSRHPIRWRRHLVLPTMWRRTDVLGALKIGVTSFFVPLWIPFLVSAMLTVLLWRKHARRAPPGHCETCGYNLTGADHKVCPECGTSMERALPGASKNVGAPS